MWPLKNIYLILLLCLSIRVDAIDDPEIAEIEDRLRLLRHGGRFQKLAQLNKKIDKLDDVRPIEDQEIKILIDKDLPANLVNETKNEMDSEEREIYDDDFALDEYYDEYDHHILREEDHDEDEEQHNIQGRIIGNMAEEVNGNQLIEVVRNYIGDPWDTFDDDQGWEDGSQSDSESETTTQKLNWVVHSTGVKHINKYRPNRQEDTSMVINHITKMNQEGYCKTPIRKVIPVQSVYPNLSKIYIPHCTLLYRCGDDAGCCKTDSYTCVPKETNKVDVYFYTNTVGRQVSMIEKLSFINHTECECVLKDDMVKDATNLFSLRPGPSYKRALNLPDPVTEAPPALRRCHCPSVFTAISTDDKDCICDCHSGQRDCLRIKRGREHLSLRDRQCILNGSCNAPNCEIGSYILEKGRCPRKHDYKINGRYYQPHNKW